MVNFPTGGKKKKLKVRVAAIEAIEASKNPHRLAMSNTRQQVCKPLVVALIGTRL